MDKTKPSPPAVSELRSHTGFWLRLVSNHVSQAFARKLLDRGDLSPSVLAGLTGMTRGAASKLIDRLVGKRLVSRQERNDDRRYQDIELTAQGGLLVPVLAAIADQNDEEFFAPLTAAERELLVATLKKLAQAHGLRSIPTE